MIAGVRCWLALAALPLHAGVIRGIVVDHYSGRPLARAQVSIEALSGAGTSVARAGLAGQFTFEEVPGGLYVIQAARPGFVTLKYGQKAWNAPGVPVLLDHGGSLFVELRLHRLPAVTGTVWDENEVGIPDQDVVAFRATRPPVQAGRARTDDRGIYRIHGLPPGSYLVRTAARGMDEEGGLLPTFHRDVATVEEARAIDLQLDETAQDVNVRPFRGKLFRVSGQIATWRPGMEVSVTLISDMGPVSGGGSGSRFSFDHVAPGAYDLVADGWWSRMHLGGYRRITLERDLEGLSLELSPYASVRVAVENKDGGRAAPGDATVQARRKTLAGTGTAQSLKGDRTELAPGPWEFAVATPPHLYPVSISAARLQELQNGRGDAWNEANLAGWVELRVIVSSKPASLRGRVTRSMGEPAPGAPVYLEALDADSKRRVTDIRSTRADARGEYRFTGLPPGTYRVVSSFEFDEPDESTMDAARPKTVSLKEAAETAQDLELYIR